MAASPRYKLFDPNGKYQASSKRPDLLAACIGILGDGSTIRDGYARKKTVLWTEGPDGDGCAWDDYDRVAELCYEREAPPFNPEELNNRQGYSYNQLRNPKQ